MSKFKQYLITEKLNLNYKLGNTYDSKDQYEIEFNVGNIEYTFIAERFYIDDSPDLKKHLDITDAKSSEVVWDVEFKQDSMPRNPGKGQYDITGEQGAKAIKVFSAVATSLKRFILTKRPNYFIFTGKETNRVKLYSRLAKMIPKISGNLYKFKTFKVRGKMIFTFIRD